jgi:NAD(P)H-flavin reductase
LRPARATTSSTAKARARPAGPVELRFDGVVYDCRDSETVLEALLRQGVPLPYSCRSGVCLTCMLRSVDGPIPPAAQEGLKGTLRLEGYFLACSCAPIADLDITLPDAASVYGRAVVTAVEPLAPNICRVVLQPATPLYYRAGQFINLRRDDGLIRSYSLASVPRLDPHLEMHVKRLPDGRMSNWIADELEPGLALDIQGPNGVSFYVPGKPDQDLLLVGNGSGLAPLIGIARDALISDHTGNIHLYHGSRHPDGLYLRETLAELATRHANFHYVPCLSGDEVPTGHRAGRADVAAFADLPDLSGWRVFLCGYPPMVHAAKRTAFLRGASLADINADPFELRELRREPRE